MLMSYAKKARWVIYPILIGAIVYLVLTQQRDYRAPSQQDYNSWIEPEVYRPNCICICY